MKHDEERGWKMVWAGIGGLAMSCLLMYLSLTPGALGLSGPLYNVVLIGLSVMELVEVYVLVRKFFGKKK